MLTEAAKIRDPSSADSEERGRRENLAPWLEVILRLLDPSDNRRHDVAEARQGLRVDLVHDAAADASAVEIVNGLQQTLGDQLSFTFRHFPMREAHQHAQHAAEVAEAAA